MFAFIAQLGMMEIIILGAFGLAVVGVVVYVLSNQNKNE